MEKELGEAQHGFAKEAHELDTLRAAVALVLGELQAPPNDGMSSLAVQLCDATEGLHEMASRAWHLGVQRSFEIARSHYENIDLELISQGVAPSYEDAMLDQIEAGVAPLAQTLAAGMEVEIALKK